ncbi:MAG: MBL fold metallo-hydrolase [Thermoanaerobacter sp.]|jgi:L-ascorbate metabolism protein UlaG (beta-lactamase superfamily)|uniref:MBL fold metallo-hydrolase n=1 Tax=unclassified Thermoanaerobacter TaxID=2636821 RepID=UPI00016423D8|nr:MBL fold metallo-hydrolase [Thermoanaerobacter sp. X514]ABY91921.1 Zn-dependent hydrolase of the beta-lactamase fold-like protein [Thermoanaerobacter sp. X514]
MNIKWLGHSCFKLTSEKGTVIVTDPFDESVGYPMPDVKADIVTSSHSHFDHNYFKAVKGNFDIVDTVGEHNIKDIKIKGVSTFHDEEQGAKRGKNIVFVVDVDGIKVCHMGDLGHVLTEKQVEEIGSVDVLLIPVGGYYTIDSKQAVEVMNQLKPKITIPMHYKTEFINFPIDTVDNFLNMTKGKKILSTEVDITKKDLEGEPKVIALNYQYSM